MKLFLLFLALAIMAMIAWRGFRSGQPPQQGQPAPDFKLPDQNGTVRSLSDFSGRWRVLYFYPKDDTPICTEEACHFRDDFVVLKGLGAEVIGISVDSPSSHARFAKKHQLPFYLLADESGEITRIYGALMDFVVFKMAKRYTFLINPEGQIAASFLYVKASSHSKEVIENLQSRVKTPKNQAGDTR